MLGKRPAADGDNKDDAWHTENLKEIDDLDDDIKELERKLGIRTDAKRRERNNTQTDREGFGIGFMSFLDQIETKTKLNAREYQKPKGEYDFNNDEFEVAMEEGDLVAASD